MLGGIRGNCLGWSPYLLTLGRWHVPSSLLCSVYGKGIPEHNFHDSQGSLFPVISEAPAALQRFFF